MPTMLRDMTACGDSIFKKVTKVKWGCEDGP